MTARYISTCVKCGEKHIQPGDTIVRVEELQGWAALSCAEELTKEKELNNPDVEFTNESIIPDTTSEPTLLLQQPIITFSTYNLRYSEEAANIVNKTRQAIYTYLGIVSTPQTWEKDLQSAVEYGIITSEDAALIQPLFSI